MIFADPPPPPHPSLSSGMHETQSMYLSSNHVQLIGILFNATLNLDSVSMYPFCKNVREFVIRFHDEGRHEYDADCGIDRLEKRIDVVMDPNNPAVAAGKYFSEDYEFTRSDLPIFTVYWKTTYIRY